MKNEAGGDTTIPTTGVETNDVQAGQFLNAFHIVDSTYELYEGIPGAVVYRYLHQVKTGE